MIFGPVAIGEAEGTVLAHSLKLGGRRLRKGKTLTRADIAELAAAGVADVTVARFEPGDVGENAAAARLAAALAPDARSVGLRVSEPFTGRVNLLADGPGVVSLSAETIHAINHVDPMLTVATVPNFQQMSPGGMVATIKVISYGVSESSVAAAEQTAYRCKGAPIRLVGPAHRTVGLVMTAIPGGLDNAKGAAVTKARVEALGLTLAECVETPHQEHDIAQALAGCASDILLILTASATSDAHDVAPEALRAAGGRVTHFGMPVDPGNLLFVGDLDGKPVIGLPGCARSPALNGADWVLSRITCGFTTTSADISAMGVGGLLKEIPTRPQPRRGTDPAPGEKVHSQVAEPET